MTDEGPMKKMQDDIIDIFKLGRLQTVSAKMETKTRPSYETAVEIENAFKFELTEKPLNENIEYYFNMLAEGVSLLASRELQGQDVAFYRIKARTLAERSVSKDIPFIRSIASVCDNLAYAVGLSEKNLPANDMGYLPDHVMSAPRLDNELIKDFDTAIEYFTELVNQTGIEEVKLIEVQDWILWINKIVTRVEGFRNIVLDRDPLEGFTEL
jgi:hypothetical protein